MKRKFTFLSAAIMLLVCLAIPTGMWGQTRATETFTYSDYTGQGGPSGTGSEYTMVKTDVSISDTKFYGNTSFVNLYAGGVSTITPASGVTITQIVLTASAANYNGFQSEGTVTPSTGSVSADGTAVTWTGSASSAFTISHNKQIRWTTIVVTYSAGSTSNCAIPTFNPAAGTYTEAQTVTISCATEGATIYYTLDGTDPTTDSEVYSSALTISETTTVKAMAVKADYNNSEVASATYEIVEPVSGYTFDFEQAASLYSDWTFANMESHQTGNSNVSAHSGTYYGTTGGKATASITTKEAIATPYTLTCYVTKQSTNTTTSTWYIQVSEDGEEWTNVASQDATSMTAGTWVEFTATLAAYTNVYVRVYYSGSTAVRNIDDLTLVTTVPSTPYINVTEPDELAYNATSGSIYYEIANYVEGTMGASTEAEWISGFTYDQVDEIGEVGFTTTENNSLDARTATISLTYTFGDNQTATADVTVTQNGNPNAPGSLNTPYTVAQARAAIDAGEGITNVYATGIVSEIVTAYNSQYGNITYNISADGTTEADQLQAYRGKSYNGENFTSEDDIQVGDIVVVYGSLTKYGETYEFLQNNQLVSLERPVVYYTITIAEGLEENLMTDPEDEAEYGEEVQILVVAPENQVLETLTVSKEDGSSVSVTPEVNGSVDEYTFTMPASNVTISATFVDASNTVTIMYSINGQDEEATILDVTSFTLPTTVDNVPNGFNFAGWTLYEDLPEINILSSYTPQDDDILVAVFSREEGAKLGNFEKVTETPSDWTGNYLIVYEDVNVAFDGSLETLDAVSNTIDVTISNGTIVANNDNLGSIFTIAAVSLKDEQSYSIRSASGKYIGKTANSNGLDENTSTVYTNTISIDEDYNAVITASGGCTLRFNTASNQARFRYYKSGQQAVQLYKQADNTPGTIAYYTRVFQNETLTSNYTITGPSIIPSGSYLNMGSNYVSNSTAAIFVIEDGGQYYSTSQTTPEATMLKDITGYGEGDGNWYFISSPFSSVTYFHNTYYYVENLVNSTAANYDLYYFDQTQTLEWRNVKLLTNQQYLLADKGYLYANKEDVTLRFVGSLYKYTTYDFTLDYSADQDFSGWNLIGNKHACNATLDKPFYRMNAAGTGYEAVTENSIVYPMEGVFVVATEAGQTATLTKVEPTTSSKGVSAINLNVSQNRGSSIDNAIIRFDNGSALGKLQFREGSTKLYIPQGDNDYAIVRSANQGEMPVNFKARENGTYTLAVDTENVEMDYLHLIDNKTGMDVDLLQTPSYTFEATTRDYASRFRLVFSANDNNAEGNAHFAYFNGSEWQISNTGEATLQVVDEMGRIVKNMAIEDNATVSINEMPGVYMMRLINGNDIKTQKVVIK